MPQVLISRTAAERALAEVERWAEIGLRQEGLPLESLLYPLSALVPTHSLLCPLELLQLEHIAAIVVDEVAIAPDEAKSYSPTNCHFESTDLRRLNEQFNAHIEALIEQKPRLGVHSKLHSHPFADGAFLSPGDIFHGITSIKAVAWRHSKGLDTAILHVAAPGSTLDDIRIPPIHCRPERYRRWMIHTWASQVDGTLVELGPTHIVHQRHPLVQAARRKPYWRTSRGARWCNAQKQTLREAGYEVSRNRLSRGWRRYLVLAGGRQLLIALPPDYPRAPVRVVRVENARCNQFEVLSLPREATEPQSFTSSSLLRLVRYYGPPR